MARFLDSSVFLHAYLTPRRELTESERRVKEGAKAIIARVEAGEPVVTTVVHVSEVVNVVESWVGLAASLRLAARILSLGNVGVLSVAEEDYWEALDVAQSYSVSLNDALAYVKMRQARIEEAYSFDRHFRNLPGIRVLTG